MHSIVQSPTDTGDDRGGAQPGSTKWLAFKAAQLHYLFALEHVGEVVQAREITHVPFTQPWFCGAITMRGVLHGVINLASFLYLGDQYNNATPHGCRLSVDEKADQLVTINPALNCPCALVVGSLQGLRKPGDFPGEAETSSSQSPLLVGIRRDRMHARWLEVDLPALVASVRSRSIKA